jgi:hypothetical protein
MCALPYGQGKKGCFAAIDLHSQKGVVAIAGRAVQDFVAGDAAVFAGFAPVDEKMAVRVAVLRISLRVLLPIGVVIPDVPRVG